MTLYEIILKTFFSESSEQLKVNIAGILLMTLFMYKMSVPVAF